MLPDGLKKHILYNAAALLYREIVAHGLGSGLPALELEVVKRAMYIMRGYGQPDDGVSYEILANDSGFIGTKVTTKGNDVAFDHTGFVWRPTAAEAAADIADVVPDIGSTIQIINHVAPFVVRSALPGNPARWR